MTKKSDAPEERKVNFPIIALCASAGGLEAYQAFFDAMPANTGMTFVVIQHLAILQESILHDLIQRHTAITVQPIIDNTRVEMDNVYVLGSGYEAEMWNGRLYLNTREQATGWPKTIDRFLQSLANDQGKWAAAVIFSGVGIDGVEGARAIKHNGGLMIAQDLLSATQTGMPSSIIDGDLADAVLRPDQVPATLLSHFEIELPHDAQLKDLIEGITDDDVALVIQRLQQQTARNFTDYKHSTLRRQIVRRMGIHRFKTTQEYLDYMSHKPEETQELVKHLLINVTNFFRDPEAFESLKVNALLSDLSKLNIDTVFRAWVPGCATGEEAVTIAILIYECLRTLNMPEMEVRIFATDVNHEILQQARAGIYPLSITREVSAERLRDHFIEDENGYRVRVHISRMIIWSDHNLVEDPPFSSLRLISCRNVMIYFQQRLQERVLALFQFALRPEGILFLGSSETLPHTNVAFTTLDSKHKIFQRAAVATNSWLRLDQPFLVRTPSQPEARIVESNPPNQEQEDHELRVIKDILAEHYASTCAIVDEFYHVRYTYGEIDCYLRLVAGRDGKHNILDMAREGLDVELTIALHQAFENNEIVTRQGVWVKTNRDERLINLIVRPINDVVLHGPRRLIIFEYTLTGHQLEGDDQASKEDEEGVTITRLRKELMKTQKALQSVTQALQAKSEELTSSMEEIRSANEEIQTTNEELRTSKEELESMNEELNTLNTQLTDQNHALSHANNTLHNFLQSADVGIIFLDQHLAIREYTSAVTAIFALRPNDKGRPLLEIVNHLNYTALIADTQHVLDTLDNVEREVRTSQGSWYMLHIYPYRTINNAVDGLVLTFSDITIQKQAQTAVEKRGEYMKMVFDQVENSLIELNTDLKVVGANQTFYNTFQIDEESAIGSHLYTLGHGQWDIPELRHLLTEVIPAQMSIQDYKLTHDFPELGLRTLSLNARQIAELDRILLMITVVSEEED